MPEGNTIAIHSTRNKAVLSLISNLIIIILTAYSVISFFTVGGKGNMALKGWYCFRFFTVDSNILVALTSLPMLLFNIRAIRRRECERAQWMRICKYIGTAAVSLTLLTVVLFLGPIFGYGPMFAGANLFMHLVTPLLAIISFVFFESGAPLKKRHTFLGLLPTFIYGTVYLILVVFIGYENGGWYDFYGFNIGGMWYLTYIVMHIVTYVICILLRRLNLRAGPLHQRSDTN